MNESFLYYIWQFQYFDKKELRTTSGESLEVIAPGILNHHAGPDFYQARIRTGGMEWAGTVEIHTRASDWMEHRHDRDRQYENVVLHVIWNDDVPVVRNDGSVLPALELRGRVDEALVRDYKTLIHNPFSIPCTRSIVRVPEVLRRSAIDRAALQRLEVKAAEVRDLFGHNKNDWEETTWQIIARNFGFKINSDPFFQLARFLPHRILLKHRDHPEQIEALLFGQAGFLEVPAGDEHYLKIQREYQVLSAKYDLSAGKLMRAQWRFLRLRPANFPTVRLAQLAALVCVLPSLFSAMTEPEKLSSFFEILEVKQSVYWRTHYQFNRKIKTEVPMLGKTSIENILINSVVPLLIAWGKFNDDQRAINKAIQFLEALPPEDNTVMRTWNLLGLSAVNAFDSQGLLELYKAWCQRRNCLTCSIGASLLKPDTEKIMR